ncbi:uncharacterized protein UTRI_04820 [Ustilago trichophora]|uniref:Uncharacterized protein n=1 Tax=Ustilago trichophora TaxID=86804 RepID=A0A5C3ECM9_9BASI|nr:uncharacterized protein UTRI_04820 [Ustilago trichophora]
MSDVAPESRDDDPPSLITKPTIVDNAEHTPSLPSSASSEPPLPINSHSTSLPHSTALPSALPSAQTSPGAQIPEFNSTVSTLQLASEALSTIPQHDPNAAHVPIAAVELLSAIQRKTKKAPAIQSPRPGSARSRSAATTPVPTALLLGVKHDSFDVTAASSRATTPTRTPSGRAKRQRRERNAATPIASVSALPSIEQNDRRRSARVAKAVTASASDSPTMPNLALFGFSPYLENLVMNAKETDRRTRSGARGIRPPVDRAPTRVKRTTAKSKNKETDPDGPDDEAKIELYRQLCIISYQLQAHLDMVPHKSLEQLRAQFATPPPDEDDGKLAPTGNDSAVPGASVNQSRATTPALPLQNQDQRPASNAATISYQQPVVVKAEPPQSPQLSYIEPQRSKPAFSPESSPEVALMHSLRSAYNDGPSHYPSYPQSNHQPRDSPEPYPWSTKVDQEEDEPMSPVFRPVRANIMSISALMDGPSHPSKQRTPSPELIRTPSRPEEMLLPSFMQEWTEEDEMASQILSTCAAAIPKLDTTELDRLTQIAQLAAFDLEMLSVPSSPRASTPSSLGVAEQQRREALSKFDPKRLNPLDTLDTEQLYNREEAEYLEEQQSNEDLYQCVRYLSSFDEVVDEWRAGELSRLRLQLEMRKAEIDRIWTCDRKFAWSNYVNDRAGELYRKAAMEASRTKWQAEMELDLLAVHRRKTRGLEKLTKNIWLPDGESAGDKEVVDLYNRFGKFLSAAKYTENDDPLVRADIRKLRDALREQKRHSKQATQSEDTAEPAGQEEVQTNEEEASEPADVDAVSSESESEDYDSDSSYASTSSSSSSGISSLPSFSSVCSTPLLPSISVADAISEMDIVVLPPDSAPASIHPAEMDEDDSDGEADESLWARQMRLATALSGVQTPAAGSALPSRATSPANSVKASMAKTQQQQRNRKRKKRPPPPGARLWKKGRVQQDDLPTAAHGEEEDVEMAHPDEGGWQNGDSHHQQKREERREGLVVEDGIPNDGPPKQALHSHSHIIHQDQQQQQEERGYPYRDQHRGYGHAYGGYGMHSSYSTGEYPEYERPPPYDNSHYSNRGYPYPLADGYHPQQQPSYGVREPYPARTPPPELLHHEQQEQQQQLQQQQQQQQQQLYPSHGSTTQHHHAGGYPPAPLPPGRPQWPY